jgi:xanthine dehydrogenase accessory factor
MSGGTLEIYLEPHLPRPQLLVIGHHPIVESLTVLGKSLDFSVTVMGLDVSKDRFPGADQVIDALDFSRFSIHPQTYVVVASHGNYDEPALEMLLPSEAGYVALVASRKRSEAVRAYLVGSGLSEQQIARLKYPAGLDIGAATPPEIALSILAEIVQIRRQAKSLPQGKPAVAKPVRTAAPDEKPKTAIDVICGMSVVIESARYHSTYENEEYYFCSAHCKRVFDQEPGKFAHTPSNPGDHQKTHSVKET